MKDYKSSSESHQKANEIRYKLYGEEGHITLDSNLENCKFIDLEQEDLKEPLTLFEETFPDFSERYRYI